MRLLRLVWLALLAAGGLQAVAAQDVLDDSVPFFPGAHAVLSHLHTCVHLVNAIKVQAGSRAPTQQPTPAPSPAAAADCRQPCTLLLLLQAGQASAFAHRNVSGQR